MKTVLAIMDRDGWDKNTDVIIVADSEEKELLWVPRDLWCHETQDRINRSYADGGFRRLERSLWLIGIETRLESMICLTPKAVAPLIDRWTVHVPVQERMDFIYPMTRQTPIEEGHKAIEFNPPFESLRGERTNQWIGARKTIPEIQFSDLLRIDRQKTFAKSLVSQFGKSNFEEFMDPQWIRFSDSKDWGALKKVDSTWNTRTFGEGRLAEVALDNKAVLVWLDDPRNRLEGRIQHLWFL